MTPNPQAAIHHKCRELILLLQVNLNHFPRHEKYGLCQEIRQCVYGVLAEHLRLELSKWSIHPVKRGVNFVGFRAWRKTRFVRKHSLCNFSRALRRGKTASVVSALGHARRTASFAHMARRCAEVPAVLAAIPPVVRLSFGALHAPV